MNPLTFPLRLLQQGSDDIHALATASKRLAEASESLVGFENRLLERIDAMEATTRHTLEQLRLLDAAVEKLNASTATLAAAVEPLQGVSERVARIAERIPGGRGDGTPDANAAGPLSKRRSRPRSSGARGWGSRSGSRRPIPNAGCRARGCRRRP